MFLRLIDLIEALSTFLIIVPLCHLCQLQLEPFSVPALIEAVRNKFSGDVCQDICVCCHIFGQCARKSLRLLTKVADNLPNSLLGDRLRIEKCLVSHAAPASLPCLQPPLQSNLMSNAIKFTEEGEVELMVQLKERTQEALSVGESVD